jgi:hypothetical protein
MHFYIGVFAVRDLSEIYIGKALQGVPSEIDRQSFAG